MDFSQFLDQVYVGNTIRDYLWVVGSLLIGGLFSRFVARKISDLIFGLVAKKGTELNKTALHDLLGKPLRWLIIMLVLFVCTSHIEYPASWDLAPVDEFGIRLVLHRIYLLFLGIVITWIALRFVKFLGIVFMERATLTESMADDQIISFLIEMIRVVVIIFAVFILLGVVFKVDIGALVAGLGIGGLALALAAKESLENLLASFIIFFDKPFIIGDLVTVNGVTGSVEKIGFRSTRIRTLEKSYLTIPNLMMVNNVLDNLSLRTFRRVNFTVGLTYDTTKEQIQEVVSATQKYIDEHPHTNQDGKIHFTQFGASSLDIMVLYYIDTMDWGVFLEVKEEINFEIMRIVQAQKAEFAFPTQTIHLDKS